ncbi:hypothetical protein [Chryseobacterium arthrosphaerae]|uniref:Uncharacterized protein n=1 Tax=Chryseobacterium arthrosphaerae TaxID=651561 RepID=A0A1B8ZT73_9FLAO|nr:hypothetical protein [Chryseobacterium arthrosphaerae]OCA74783.1 hypothetical protein BBI00_10750 [Chryseobacterium arthrosphaerae]
MAVYILNNRKIVRHKGERLDFFSNEYSIPIRIAQSNSDNNKERTVSLLNSDMTYKVSEDSENSFNKLSLLDNRISITEIFQLTQKYLLRDQVKRTNPLTG